MTLVVELLFLVVPLLLAFGTVLAIYIYVQSRKRQSMRQLSRVLGATYDANWISAPFGVARGNMLGRDFNVYPYLAGRFGGGGETRVECHCLAEALCRGVYHWRTTQVRDLPSELLNELRQLPIAKEPLFEDSLKTLLRGSLRFYRDIENVIWRGDYDFIGVKTPEEVAMLVQLVVRMAISIENPEIQRKIIAMSPLSTSAT